MSLWAALITGIFSANNSKNVKKGSSTRSATTLSWIPLVLLFCTSRHKKQMSTFVHTMQHAGGSMRSAQTHMHLGYHTSLFLSTGTFLCFQLGEQLSPWT